MQIEPYLFFNGNCGDAIAYYRDAIGAEEMFRMRFADAPPDAQRPPISADMADKVMHASLRIGDSTVMMSDGGCMEKDKQHAFSGFSLSLTGQDMSTAERYFNALAKDGSVTMPFQKTFWSPGFGMVTDRFGISWMVTAPPDEHDD